MDLITPPTLINATSGQGSVTLEIPSSYQVHASSGEGNVSDGVADNPASDRIFNLTSGRDVTSVSAPLSQSPWLVETRWT